MAPCLAASTLVRIDIRSHQGMEWDTGLSIASPSTTKYRYRTHRPALCQTCRQINFERLFGFSNKFLHLHRLPKWRLEVLLSQFECEFCNFLATRILAATGYPDAKTLVCKRQN